MIRHILFICLASLVLQSSADTETDASRDTNCQELGFSGAQKCSDCDKLADYVKDEGLATECRQCCVQDSTSGSRKFKSAVLEVCKHRLRETPHVEGFIKDKIDNFPTLSVSYKLYATPRLLLKSGKRREAISIDNWKTEHIEEYLKDKLLDRSSEGVSLR